MSIVVVDHGLLAGDLTKAQLRGLTIATSAHGRSTAANTAKIGCHVRHGIAPEDVLIQLQPEIAQRVW